MPKGNRRGAGGRTSTKAAGRASRQAGRKGATTKRAPRQSAERRTNRDGSAVDPATTAAEGRRPQL
jgi:hypothetical protein